ncbi:MULTISPECIES: AraC family transcriptional regulator [Lactobacillus]|uniref:AraC family transcriptional regulator n=1 Tax=Lactobacillus xujianguonis TaxID=2495899 RepID=A0A437SV58_9LACO|nr:MULTISPECIES: AraC family transcriptional regulator [Lactobacillus]RVU70794.1 AraC family transcriptional regulator [Lactobacillus xujianguonis]RVU77014.1 AraC family transcriptional regulator [Lactobacillus xujianguonis]
MTEDQQYTVKNDSRKTILTKLKFAHFDYEQYFETFDTEDKREQSIIKELDQQLNNQHFIWFKTGKEMHSARMMDRVIHEYLADEVFGEALVKAQLKLIFVMSLRAKIISEKRDKKFNQDKFERYVEENLATVTLQEAAEEFGFNMNYFSNLVKRTLGQNFSSYLNQQKMERAKELVVNGNDPIKDIITALGYSSRANFYRQFNEYYGETPAGMRKRLKK